jgi:hypothetical protein
MSGAIIVFIFQHCSQNFQGLQKEIRILSKKKKENQKFLHKNEFQKYLLQP